MNLHQRAVLAWLAQSHPQKKGLETKLARVPTPGRAPRPLASSTAFRLRGQLGTWEAAGTAQAGHWNFAQTLKSGEPEFDHRVWSECRFRPVEGHA